MRVFSLVMGFIGIFVSRPIQIIFNPYYKQCAGNYLISHLAKVFFCVEIMDIQVSFYNALHRIQNEQ